MAVFDKEALLSSLSQLDQPGRLAFAASVCERLLPNYRAFAAIEQWGDPMRLRMTLDSIWGAAGSREMARDEIERLVTACTGVIPDSEDFGSVFTGIAQYSAAALLHTLEYLLDSDLAKLAQVGQLAVDSIDEYLSAVCEPAFDAFDEHMQEWIDLSPMLAAEVSKQQEDLELIRGWQGPAADLVQHLRASSSLAGIQPFKRGIVKETAEK